MAISNASRHNEGSAPEEGVAASVWFPRAREVELRQEQLPVTGPSEVRVRSAASALSHGTEMLVYRGQVPRELDLDLPTLRGNYGFPIKYGYASVGRVVAVGDGVERLQEGDRVFVHHPHQTEYVVPASMAVPLPGNIDFEVGVFLANLETAVNVMLDANPHLGERVLVLGQGVIGLLLTQLARRTGASQVIAVDPLAIRRERAAMVGADFVLQPDGSLAEKVLDLTQGMGADIVLEASGNPTALGQAIECAAFQATVVVCSWYGTKPVLTTLGSAFHRKRLRIVSSQVSAIDPALQPRWNHSRRLRLARDLLSNLKLAPLITQRIPFSRAADAYSLVDQHPEEIVQVILTYENGEEKGCLS